MANRSFLTKVRIHLYCDAVNPVLDFSSKFLNEDTIDRIDLFFIKLLFGKGTPVE